MISNHSQAGKYFPSHFFGIDRKFIENLKKIHENVWKTYRKFMENRWKIHRKSMEMNRLTIENFIKNVWNVHGKFIENS